jgi:ABC-type Fe3+ transport system permease subunit
MPIAPCSRAAISNRRSCTSAALALATIVVVATIAVPTAYFVRMRLPRLAGIVEFITLLPLVIPAIVLVFGFIRLYGSSSILPLTATSLGADALLMFGYVGLSLPYMYRAVDTALQAIDARTLTEAAQVRHHRLALPAPSAPLPAGDRGSRLARRAGLVSISSWREASERFR